ncbi:MAG TPA: metallopeptidase TldD-related protein, partial [Gaiellaceae bacterium]|nr:metallopeptidase TldD-related protein [Gaiellaceae bacterium]
MSRVLDLADEALRTAGGDDAEVLVHAERSGVARFAASIVHQPTLIENAVVRVRIARDGKVGWAATNRVDAEGLAEVARRAAEAADSAKPDPDFPGFSPPAAYAEVGGYDEETAALGAADQARLAAAAIEAAGNFGLYGIYTSGVTEIAVASSTGLAAEQETTDIVCLCLAADNEASGWSERTGWRAADVDPAEPAREAAETAARTRGGAELEPGAYRAVLEPVAVADLVRWFSYDSMGAQGYLEERSYFCGRIGEQPFDPKVSIADDALDSANLPRPFDFEGTPKQRVPMIEDGVIRGVVWDRTTAARALDGQSTTGHAPPDAWRFFGPLPMAFDMASGEAGSAEELAELVGDGIFVTRLHYLSVVD